MGELDPIKSDQLSTFVMMSADLETINSGPLTRMKGLSSNDNSSAFKSASGGFKRATLALGQVIGFNDQTTASLMFMANGLELVAAAGEIYSAYRALANTKALASIARGVAAIIPQMAVPPWGLAVAGVAAVGAYAFNEVIKDSMRQADVTVDLEGYDPVGQIKQALVAQGINI